MQPVTFADVLRAKRRIRPYLARTPLQKWGQKAPGFSRGMNGLSGLPLSRHSVRIAGRTPCTLPILNTVCRFRGESFPRVKAVTHLGRVRSA